METTTSKAEQSGWPNWLDRHRYSLSLVLFGAFFALYGWLVYTAGKRPLSPVEQASLGLIGVVVSGAVGVLLAIPFATRRIRIGSQLRRAYGISLALQSIQADVREAISRMHERSELKPEALAMLWEELAVNIRISLRLPILEAERIVEDWGEMALGERERIRKAEHERRAEVEALYQELETAQSVKQDLEATDEHSEELQAGIQSVERRILTLEESLRSRGEIYVAGTASALMSGGHYAKAIEAYNEIIRQHPTAYTNYIRRAKARFLAGDRDGALVDLDKANSLHPYGTAHLDEIGQLRKQMLAGGVFAVGGVPTYDARAECTAGNLELALGNAAQAEDHFQKALAGGWSEIYTRVNLAMTYCLAGNPSQAAAELSKYEPTPGSYVELNTTALKAICSIAEGQPVSDYLAPLRNQLQVLSDKDFSHSPLRYLEAGLLQKNPDLAQRARPLFDILREGSSPRDQLSLNRVEPTDGN